MCPCHVNRGCVFVWLWHACWECGVMTTGCMVSFVSDRLCPLYLPLPLSLAVFVPHPLFAEAPCEVAWTFPVLLAGLVLTSLTDTAIALVCFDLINGSYGFACCCSTNHHWFTILISNSSLFTHLHLALAADLQHSSTCCSLPATDLYIINNLFPFLVFCLVE